MRTGDPRLTGRSNSRSSGTHRSMVLPLARREPGTKPRSRSHDDLSRWEVRTPSPPPPSRSTGKDLWCRRSSYVSLSLLGHPRDPWTFRGRSSPFLGLEFTPESASFGLKLQAGRWSKTVLVPGYDYNRMLGERRFIASPVLRRLCRRGERVDAPTSARTMQLTLERERTRDRSYGEF